MSCENIYKMSDNKNKKLTIQDRMQDGGDKIVDSDISFREAWKNGVEVDINKYLEENNINDKEVKNMKGLEDLKQKYPRPVIDFELDEEDEEMCDAYLLPDELEEFLNSADNEEDDE